jgi:hypothetical protein
LLKEHVEFARFVSPVDSGQNGEPIGPKSVTCAMSQLCCLLIPAGKHNLKPFGIHTGKDHYNKAWKVFFRSTENINEAKILQKMYELERQFNLERYKWVKP